MKPVGAWFITFRLLCRVHCASALRDYLFLGDWLRVINHAPSPAGLPVSQRIAERDKSRPFYVANQITGNLFTYFNTDCQSFIIGLHFLQGTGIHAGAMSRLYSHTAWIVSLAGVCVPFKSPVKQTSIRDTVMVPSLLLNNRTGQTP